MREKGRDKIDIVYFFSLLKINNVASAAAAIDRVR